MREWITGMIKRWTGAGAVENVRGELEARRFAVERIEALTRRVSRAPVDERLGRPA